MQSIFEKPSANGVDIFIRFFYNAYLVDKLYFKSYVQNVFEEVYDVDDQEIYTSESPRSANLFTWTLNNFKQQNINEIDYQSKISSILEEEEQIFDSTTAYTVRCLQKDNFDRKMFLMNLNSLLLMIQQAYGEVAAYIKSENDDLLFFMPNITVDHSPYPIMNASLNYLNLLISKAFSCVFNGPQRQYVMKNINTYNLGRNIILSALKILDSEIFWMRYRLRFNKLRTSFLDVQKYYLLFLVINPAIPTSHFIIDRTRKLIDGMPFNTYENIFYRSALISEDKYLNDIYTYEIKRLFPSLDTFTKFSPLYNNNYDCRFDPKFSFVAAIYAAQGRLDEILNLYRTSIGTFGLGLFSRLSDFMETSFSEIEQLHRTHNIFDQSFYQARANLRQMIDDHYGSFRDENKANGVNISCETLSSKAILEEYTVTNMIEYYVIGSLLSLSIGNYSECLRHLLNGTNTLQTTIRFLTKKSIEIQELMKTSHEFLQNINQKLSDVTDSYTYDRFDSTPNDDAGFVDNIIIHVASRSLMSLKDPKADQSESQAFLKAKLGILFREKYHWFPEITSDLHHSLEIFYEHGPLNTAISTDQDQIRYDELIQIILKMEENFTKHQEEDLLNTVTYNENIGKHCPLSMSTKLDTETIGTSTNYLKAANFCAKFNLGGKKIDENNAAGHEGAPLNLQMPNLSLSNVPDLSSNNKKTDSSSLERESIDGQRKDAMADRTEIHEVQQTTQSTNKNYNILALDGGGIRGIAQAIVLMEIERRTGRKIGELFHCFIGTSTGGILACGLARRQPLSARALLQLYMGPTRLNIFDKRFLSKIQRIWTSKYSGYGIEQVLNQKFHEEKLSDCSPHDLIIPVEIQGIGPALFINDSRPNEKPGLWLYKPSDLEHNFIRFSTTDRPLREVTRCTSAGAPYFPPKKLTIDGKAHTFYDGGYRFNRPDHIALKWAIDSKGISQENIFLLSIGNSSDDAIPLPNIHGIGGFVIRTPAISEVIGYNNPGLYCDAILKSNYFRVTLKLDQSLALDAYDPADLQLLWLKTWEKIKEMDDDPGDTFNTLCQRLLERCELAMENLRPVQMLHHLTYFPGRYERDPDSYESIDQLFERAADPKQKDLNHQINRYFHKNKDTADRIYYPLKFPSIHNESAFLLAAAIGHIKSIALYTKLTSQDLLNREQITHKMLKLKHLDWIWNPYHYAAANAEMIAFLYLLHKKGIETVNLGENSDRSALLRMKRQFFVRTRTFPRRYTVTELANDCGNTLMERQLNSYLSRILSLIEKMEC